MDLGVITLSIILSSFFVFISVFHLIELAGIYPKLQPKHQATSKEWVVVAQMITVNVLWLTPCTLLSGPLLEAFLQPIEDPLPPLYVTLLKVSVFLILDDLFFYVYHRVLHSVPFLYRTIHKPHHFFIAPFPAVSFCQHPVEIMLQGIGALLPFMYATHPYEFWLYLVLRIYLGVEDHAGMDIPCSPSHLLPSIFGGAKHHDVHHEKFNCNYASVFRFIDDWAGSSV